MSKVPKVISRPDEGLIVDQVKHAVVSAREISKPRSIRQTGTHRAFEIVCKGNVTMRIEKAYYKSDS